MNRKIVKYPDTILEEKIEPFDFSNKNIDPIELEKEMLDIMYEHDGIGLAANQIGLKHRVFVMGHKDTPETGMAFFNPMVLEVSEEIDDLEEGCLSFPGIYAKVKRPKRIKVRWQNSKGESLESELSGYECKCFLHELDHLEGIVFRDRLSQLKWNMAVKKSKKRN
jgi:peptide deformylase